MPVQQVFKKYEVITAATAEQIGLSITAMLLADAGWRLAAPMSCVAKPDGSVMYYVGMTQFECVVIPDQPTTEVK